MATRTDEPAGLKKKAAPAKKALASKAASTPRKPTAPAATKAPVAASKAGAGGLLRAGLKALGNVHNDVVKRQTHVIESLLGVRVSDEVKAHAFAAPGSFGFRKFEDVFDQRVATALERLGVPSAQEVEALRDEVRQLREQLERGQGSRAKR